MKFVVYFFIYYFISLSVLAEKIATVRLSYIINNSSEFSIFLDNLDKYKLDFFNELKEVENELQKRKIEIQDSKILFNEAEYQKLVEQFNKDNEIHQKKIQKYEDFLNYNMEKNKETIVKDISQIIEKYSINNNIDIIFNEDQYFISSSTLDISDIIIEKLNKKVLKLQILEK